MPRLSKIGAAALAAFGWTSGGGGVTASYLVVAGGASGGSGRGGGGGAGGLLTGTASLNTTLSYTVTVGAGGASATSAQGTNGSNSVFNSITATGGGGGGSSVGGLNSGKNGGSGGGQCGDSATPQGTAGSGTSGQGNNGGAGSASSAGGGGGGSNAVGNAASGTTAGNGGAGTASSITGSSVTYAGGGGGGSLSGAGGSGGSGGGGTGASGASGGVAGTANTGGGGGGAGNDGTASSAGGSGVVIISYASPQKFGGGIVTTSGSNTIHTFTTSGTLSPLSTLSASYLIVAGGGGGGGAAWSGGGGAGGLLSGSGTTIDTNSTYLVTVGSGGAGGTTSVKGTNGTSSAFSMVTTTAVGGGGGAAGDADGQQTGLSGGSGGGGGSSGSGGAMTGSGGAGTSGQGFAGGAGGTDAVSWRSGGGGGGSGSVGADRSTGNGGNGGSGTASSISGTSVTYAGGGAGAGNFSNGTATGGGGAATNSGGGGAGTANTGGGGGGTGSGSGGAGGSGIVIISYAGSVQQMAGGTVTISGGNVIHTFTSSGYLTPLKLVPNSLRFRASNAAYLSRTPTVAGSQTTWTFSAWVKRGDLSGTNPITLLSCAPSDGSTRTVITFENDNSLDFFYYNGSTYPLGIQTTALYRDPASWYHIVVVYDSTQATSSNRAKIYVNGTQVTSFQSATYPSQNATATINSAQVHNIGRRAYFNDRYFDGELTEVNLIDGQALTPNSFGTFNSYGVWQPITYGGSYGTNGFYLPFTNKTSTTTLGYDFSPAGNNWTTNNISLTAGSTYDSMIDVPTLTSATAANYAVLNPLDTYDNPPTQGNLTRTGVGHTGSPWSTCRGTLGVSSGKWYFEATLTGSTGSTGNNMVGVMTTTTSTLSDAYGGSTTRSYQANGNLQGNNSTGTVSSAVSGDVIMIAFDVDAGKLWVGKNGTWMNSGVPASGTGNVFTTLPTSPIVPQVSMYGNTGDNYGWYMNFGQQGFKYTPPTDFVALNTYNL